MTKNGTLRNPMSTDQQEDDAPLTLRRRIWIILDVEAPMSPVPFAINLALATLIVLNVIAVLLETVPSLHTEYKWQFSAFEAFSVFVFTIEYLLRLWVAPEGRPDLPPGRARWRGIRSPMAIIDLIAILPSLLAMFVPFDLRILRVLRVLRVFKLTRYSSAMTILLDVLKEEASSLFAAIFILLILLILTSAGAYIVEHQAQPENFGSIPAAMWWAMVTLTTVGYGDVTPVTPLGRVFGGLVTLIGVGMAALPAGILASGLNEQLHNRRDTLRNQFRLALENGSIDPKEETGIEKLRKQLKISRPVADSIRYEILLRQEKLARETCPHCGKSLQLDHHNT